METIDIWRYISAASITPLAIPTVAVLIPRWRYPPKMVIALVAIMEVATCCLAAIFPLIFGVTYVATWVAGLVLPAFGLLVFSRCTTVRDGRLLFLIITIIIDTTICEIFSCVFYSRSQWQWVAVRAVFSVAQTVLLWFFCRKPLEKMMDANRVDWGHASIIPIALLCGLLGSYFSPGCFSYPHSIPVSSICICVTVVIVYIGLYRFQEATLQQAEITRYNALLRSEINALQRAEKQAEKNDRDLRILHHDIRHYMSMFQGCLETGNVDAAKDILDMMEKNSNDFSKSSGLTPYTGITILDTVFTQTAQQAAAINAEFEVRIEMPDSLSVDPYALAVVLSNALENALNALGKEPRGKPRRLTVAGRPQGSQLLLQITNSFSGALTLDAKTGLPSTKEDGHGYGMKSISDFAQKNGCALDCTVNDGAYSLRLLI